MTPRRPVRAREGLLVLTGTLGLGLVGLLGLTGIEPSKIFLGAVFAGGAAILFLKPEAGLFALILNALLGLTHLATLPRIGVISAPVALELALTLSVLFQALFHRRPVFIASPQHLLILALTVWMLVSLLVVDRVGPENLAALRNLYLVRMLVLMLMTNILLSGTALKRFVATLMIANAGLLVTSFLVREGFLGAARQEYSEVILLRTSGIVHNANNLAFDLTTMLIFCAASLFYVKDVRLKILLGLLAGFDLLAILTTLSRSGFVSLCAVILFLFYRMKSARVAFVLVSFALLAALLLPSGLLFRFSRIEELKDVDRVKYARVGLNAAMHNPIFGIGFGSYISDFPVYNDTDLKEAVPTHNMYMNLASQAGFPALTLYMAAVILLWRRMRAMEASLEAQGGRASFLYQFGWAVQGSLVNLLVFGLSGDVEFEYSVFIVLGFGMLLYREHQRRLQGVPRGVLAPQEAGSSF
jgi:O-antigen ligase